MEKQNEIDFAKKDAFLRFLLQRTDTRLAFIGFLLILPGFITEELAGMDIPWLMIPSFAALIVAGIPIFRSAYFSIVKEHTININVLMSIACIGAVVIGEMTEAGMVVVLFALGEAMEEFTSEKAHHSIQSLMEVIPQEALVLQLNQGVWKEEIIHINQLRPGDHIIVKPGERIPMDGIVIKGTSNINQASITGESRLLEKGPGDGVYASSINGEDVLEIEVTHLAEDTTISRMLHMVKEAQERKSPAQRFIDQFAKVYTPAVILIAALVVAIPTLFFHQPFWGTSGWLYKGLSLLIISCPCALVISTPVSLIAAITNAAQQGILFKGGIALETLAKVKTIAFDKTGTITAGKPAVKYIRSINCSKSTCQSAQKYCPACEDLLSLTYAVEKYSEHPLAQAIISEGSKTGLTERYPAAEKVSAQTGKGVSGIVSGNDIFIGSHTAFVQIPHPDDHCSYANMDAINGLTPILISKNQCYEGTITLEDTLRDTARESIQQLTHQGIHPILLSGDQETTVQIIAGQVGIDQFSAGLLPEDKVHKIEMLTRSGEVAMVGDGINDTPALAAANVSFAVSGSMGGTGQAMETADIVLLRDDLRLVPFAVRISRAAMQTIRLNMGLTLFLKLSVFLLVFFGLGTMWMAVLADTGTMVLVTMISMRLLKHPKFLSL